jgi:hypothetical protein
VFYNTIVAQAQKIEVTADRVVFTFSPNQRALRDRFETDRGWLEGLAHQIAGAKITFASVLMESAPPAPPNAASGEAAEPSQAANKPADKKSALKAQAMADANVQALLEVFPAEIRDVEEM